MKALMSVGYEMKNMLIVAASFCTLASQSAYAQFWDEPPPQFWDDRGYYRHQHHGGGRVASGGQRPFIQPVAPPQVAFSGPYAQDSIVIDTGGRKLYYVTSPTTAFAYPLGVGRQGFTWTGKETISHITDWPDWYPPSDMRERRPELPAKMTGGINNPLGVKAIYLGKTLYRIHGTNEPKSVGKAESSGCFRMTNENVLHLASLIKIGTEVTVVSSLGNNAPVASDEEPQQPSPPPPVDEPEPAMSEPPLLPPPPPPRPSRTVHIQTPFGQVWIDLPPRRHRQFRRGVGADYYPFFDYSGR